MYCHLTVQLVRQLADLLHLVVPEGLPLTVRAVCQLDKVDTVADLPPDLAEHLWETIGHDTKHARRIADRFGVLAAGEAVARGDVAARGRHPGALYRSSAYAATQCDANVIGTTGL